MLLQQRLMRMVAFMLLVLAAARRLEPMPRTRV
jgi:hypothetical protein